MAAGTFFLKSFNALYRALYTIMSFLLIPCLIRILGSFISCQTFLTFNGFIKVVMVDREINPSIDLGDRDAASAGSSSGC